MKTEKQSETTKLLSEVEIEAKVKVFREQLEKINELYKELLSYHIAGDFYIGPHLSHTYLPDKVVFKKTVVTRY